MLAARLSESGEHSVLLVEAGGRPSAAAHVPFFGPSLQQSPINWRYFTEPQRNATKSLNQRVSFSFPPSDTRAARARF